MPRRDALLATSNRSADTAKVNWRRKIFTCVLCITLLMQGVAAVAAAPVCAHQHDPQQAVVADVMPASHHTLHAASETNTAAQPHPQQHGACDCDQDCAGSCVLHSPGQLLPGDLFALSAPRHDAYPLHADERPYPTVVTPRLRPPTLS